MENVRKFLPVIIGGIVALAFFFISRKIRKSGGDYQERSQILEKAREAKLAKSILKKSENEESSSNIE
jgi:hypothetical protein